MATFIHPSIPVLSPSFLYHPYIPSFQSKDFSFTCYIMDSMCNLSKFIFRQSIMHDCASGLDCNSKGTSSSHDISHYASLYHYSMLNKKLIIIHIALRQKHISIFRVILSASVPMSCIQRISRLSLVFHYKTVLSPTYFLRTENILLNWNLTLLYTL